MAKKLSEFEESLEGLNTMKRPWENNWSDEEMEELKEKYWKDRREKEAAEVARARTGSVAGAGAAGARRRRNEGQPSTGTNPTGARPTTTSLASLPGVPVAGAARPPTTSHSPPPSSLRPPAFASTSTSRQPPPPPPPHSPPGPTAMDLDAPTNDSIISFTSTSHSVAGPSVSVPPKTRLVETGKTTQRKREREVEIVDSSEDSDNSSRGLELKKKLAKKSLAAAVATPPSVRGKRGRPVAPPSLEKQIETTIKLKTQEKLYGKYRTVKLFLSALDGLQCEGPSTRVFEGCRIAFVYGTGPDGPLANGIAHALVLRTRNILQGGGKVIAGEDFVPSPARGNETDSEWEERATREGWTTHIIPFEGGLEEINGVVNFKFQRHILPFLGNFKMKLDQVGTYAKAVSWQWASHSLASYRRNGEAVKVSEEPFLIPRGDAATIPSPAAADRSRRKSKTEGKDKGKGKGKRNDEDEWDTSGAEDEDLDDLKRRVRNFSPLHAAKDWPAETYQERPPPEVLVATDPSSDPIADSTVPPSTSRTVATLSSRALPHTGTVQDAFEDLRQEMDDVKEFGDAIDDDAIFQLDQELSDTMIISAIPDDDFETDEENAALSGRGRGSTSSAKKPSANSPAKSPSKGAYACELSSTGGASTAGPNERVARVLEEISKLYTHSKDKNATFRATSYRRAAGILRNSTVRIDTYDRAKQFKGIGVKLAKKIVEITKTGTHRLLKNSTDKDRVVKLLCGVYGIGYAKAENFYELGVRTIQELSEMEGLSASMKLGIEYYDDLAKRIPREEVAQLFEYVKSAAQKVDPGLQVECMGSFRRGQEDCGDIDILVTRDPSDDGVTHAGMIRKLWKALEKEGIVRYSLNSPTDWHAIDAKINGLCALPGGLMRRIDVLGVPWDEMPAALIYFTGNDFFNRSLRLKARHMGMRLNQRGLYKNVLRGKAGVKLTEGTRIDCRTEKDIFDALKVTWRAPAERLP